MQMLSLEQWNTVFNNLEDMEEEDRYDNEIEWVEIICLDSSNEWVLAYGEELFEDGFQSEEEAQERLSYLEKKYFKGKLKSNKNT